MIVNPDDVISAGLGLLPSKMDTPQARAMLHAIGRQESRFIHRRQIGGPARGFWQFERGTASSRGGVWGVYLHPTSRQHLQSVCMNLGVTFEPDAIYRALETNDALAAATARLLLYTDPSRLPAVQNANVETAWAYYLRTWRPGKPHRKTWGPFWKEACDRYGAGA